MRCKARGIAGYHEHPDTNKNPRKSAQIRAIRDKKTGCETPGNG